MAGACAPTIDARFSCEGSLVALAVDLFGVEELFAEFGHGAVGVETAEKAARVARVTGGAADLLDLDRRAHV